MPFGPALSLLSSPRTLCHISSIWLRSSYILSKNSGFRISMCSIFSTETTAWYSVCINFFQHACLNQSLLPSVAPLIARKLTGHTQKVTAGLRTLNRMPYTFYDSINNVILSYMEGNYQLILAMVTERSPQMQKQ